NVIGHEASAEALKTAIQRWPWANIIQSDIQAKDLDQFRYVVPEPGVLIPVPQECDILILCEILEHLPDPMALCARWMPHAKACLISSPLQGDRSGDLSG